MKNKRTEMFYTVVLALPVVALGVGVICGILALFTGCFT